MESIAKSLEGIKTRFQKDLDELTNILFNCFDSFKELIDKDLYK